MTPLGVAVVDDVLMFMNEAAPFTQLYSTVESRMTADTLRVSSFSTDNNSGSPGCCAPQLCSNLLNFARHRIQLFHSNRFLTDHFVPSVGGDPAVPPPKPVKL